jgi:ferric-dicitrate binding protein FerR (iron transport regulator)
MEIKDLLNDESFRNWANNSNQKDSEKWEKYILLNPEDKEFLLSVSAMIVNSNFKPISPEESIIKEDWKLLEKNISEISVNQTHRKLWIKIASIAASFFIIGFLGYQMFFSGSHVNSLITYSTGPGEIMKYQLGDGSMVTLNGNSSISFAEGLVSSNPREVNLIGEAYFEVVHLNNNQLFQVITKNARTEVLGTVFNIKARSENSIVSLLEGRVNVQNSNSKIKKTLQPGESARIDENSLSIRKTNVTSLASWRNNLWIFDNEPLSEVLTNLEESFGISYSIESNVDASQKISGKLSTQNLKTLYRALETMLEIEIMSQDNKITITK